MLGLGFVWAWVRHGRRIDTIFDSMERSFTNNPPPENGEVASPKTSPTEENTSSKTNKPSDFQRAIFLGRMVLGFTTLAAVLVGAAAIHSGAWTGLGVSLIMIIASATYYRWMLRSLTREQVEERSNRTGT